MFCSKCGHQIADGAKFCPFCGAPVTASPRPPVTPQPPVSPASPASPRPGTHAAPKKKGAGKKKLMIAISAACAVVLTAAAVTGVAVYRKNREAEKREAENQRRMEELEDSFDDAVAEAAGFDVRDMDGALDDLQDRWNDLDASDLEGKAELIDEARAMSDEARDKAESLDAHAGSLAGFQSSLPDCDLGVGLAEYAACREALDAYADAVESRDAARADAALESLSAAQDSLLAANRAYLEGRRELYSTVDMSYATPEDTQAYSAAMDALSAAASSGTVSGGLTEALSTLDSLSAAYAQPARSLTIGVQQVDVTDFPTVRLYASITDSQTGEVPTGLDPVLFFIDKRDANGDFIRQTVTAATQLTGVESLSVDMVADVSGSMYGYPLSEAKTVMNSFIRSVQFSAGDRVELTAFSTGVYLVEPFSSDADLLTSRVNGLETDDMTSLYDALCTAVTRVAPEAGARCVIAFTDGLDNYSSSSPQDVISLAQRYNVPIFIIGIGGSIDTDVYNIASTTGGAYYNVTNISSMSDIYNEIYRREKELYLIEFTDNTGADATDASSVEITYRSPEYGGQTGYVYTPNILMDVTDEYLYTSGPEATVEGYLKNFDDAMTYQSFSYIESYLKPGSGIYTTQQKYVLKGITEQLDSYEIEDVSYSSSDACVVTTRETFHVQKSGQPLKLLTQRCQYALSLENGVWYMTDFAAPVEVVLKINQ